MADWGGGTSQNITGYQYNPADFGGLSAEEYQRSINGIMSGMGGAPVQQYITSYPGDTPQAPVASFGGGVSQTPAGPAYQYNPADFGGVSAEQYNQSKAGIMAALGGPVPNLGFESNTAQTGNYSAPQLTDARNFQAGNYSAPQLSDQRNFQTGGGDPMVPAFGGSPVYGGANVAGQPNVQTPATGPQSSFSATGQWQSNPYLDDQAQAIMRNTTTNLQRNILPQINSAAQLAGGFGGSRQGVVQSNAMLDANNAIANGLSTLYGNAYNQDRAYQLGLGNLGLNSQQLANNYNLGLGNLGLGFYNAGNNYNLGMGNLQLGNRNTDLQQVQLGANMFNTGNTGLGSVGTGITNVGNTVQNAPWQVLNNATANYSPYTGLGVSNTQTQNGSMLGNVAGGAVLGNTLANAWKGGGTTSGFNNGSYGAGVNPLTGEYYGSLGF